MDLIIESFKRLYRCNQINDDTLKFLLEKGIITEANKEYIMQKGDD